MSEDNNPLGSVYISYRAIATIACQSALESYGVVGLAARNMVEGLSQVLVKDPSLGVDVRFSGHTISVDLYITIEYGVRIKTVTTTVADRVRYQLEKTLGFPVSKVNVHVNALRVSDTD